MIKINQLSKYHNVGQGLFYSATIRNEDSQQDFKYIIDCGTSKGASELKFEIIEYLEEQEKNSILDILIISHLHQDHISGLNQLLTGFSKKNIRIKNLFIPYYLKKQREYLYIYWFKKLGKDEGWILEFILNPVEYLDRFNVVDNIIFVHPNDSKYNEPAENVVLSIDDNKSLKIAGKNVFNNEKDTESKVSKLFHSSEVTVTSMALIEFDFWVKECSSAKLDEFTKNMKRLIGKGLSLNDIAQRVSKYRKFYEVYKKLHKDFNDTSLCVLVSNLNDVSNVEDCFIGDLDLTNYLSIGGVKLPQSSNKIDKGFSLSKRNTNFGYLFTGDINFAPNTDGSSNDTYIDFVHHYQPKLKKVQFLTVPHHGSRHNWDYRLLSDCDYPISVVSSAQTGKYGHPDYTVVKDIEQYGWAWANESDSITIRHSITFK